MDAGQSLIADLEDAIQSGSKDKRVETLRRITDLFVADADRLSDQQIDVFDDVLGHLIKRIESKALAELSRRLGPINNAPIEVVRRLARDDNITVAEPILTTSLRLSDGDLIDIASSKTQAHLLAISARQQIGASVTDVLLQRGDREVLHKLAGNSGADFSVIGFETSGAAFGARRTTGRESRAAAGRPVAAISGVVVARHRGGAFAPSCLGRPGEP